MALLPPAVTGIVATNLAACGIIGLSTAQLALGIGTGFSLYMTSVVTVNTADVGTLGGGAGIGLGLTLAPPVLMQSLRSTFEANGISGPSKDQMITAISSAVSQALLLVQVVTAHGGVGVGTGTIVSVNPVPAASIPMMIANFLSVGLIGLASASLATAIASGIDQSLASAKGQVVIVGPPSPFPGGGGGFGKIF